MAVWKRGTGTVINRPRWSRSATRSAARSGVPHRREPRQRMPTCGNVCDIKRNPAIGELGCPRAGDFAWHSSAICRRTEGLRPEGHRGASSSGTDRFMTTTRKLPCEAKTSTNTWTGSIRKRPVLRAVWVLGGCSMSNRLVRRGAAPRSGSSVAAALCGPPPVAVVVRCGGRGACGR